MQLLHTSTSLEPSFNCSLVKVKVKGKAFLKYSDWIWKILKWKVMFHVSLTSFKVFLFHFFVADSKPVYYPNCYIFWCAKISSVDYFKVLIYNLFLNIISVRSMRRKMKRMDLVAKIIQLLLPRKWKMH